MNNVLFSLLELQKISQRIPKLMYFTDRKIYLQNKDNFNENNQINFHFEIK